MKVITTAIQFLIVLHVRAQEIGEKCGGGIFTGGECALLEDCDPAIADLRLRNIRPKSCGFLGNKPIVCCRFPQWKFQTVRKHCRPKPHLVLPDGTTLGGGFGGFDSVAKEFPHMSALGFENGKEIIWGCGGTLISSDFVLTAAHCLISRDLGPVKYVRLGDLNLKRSDDLAKPQDFTVKKTYRHPDYHPPTQYNDIALIQLDREAIFDDFVKPACLMTNTSFTDKSLIATGWGRLGHDGELAEHLQKMYIKLVPKDVCQQKYEKHKSRKLPNGIIDSQICAGAPKIDTCAGDSGGPLQAYRLNGHLIYGVTSFGVACGLTSTPGVYTKISSYINWIDSIVWPNGDNYYQDV